MSTKVTLIKVIDSINNCPDCEKCISIFESYNAMTEYGTISVGEPHPLKDQIIEKFDGVEIS